MAAVDNLVVDHGRADLFVGPLGICHVSQLVDISHEHSDGYLGDMVQRNQIGGSFRSDVEEGVVVWSILLKAGLFEVLSVMKQRFNRAAIGFVVHINLETVLVVVSRITAHKKSL